MSNAQLKPPETPSERLEGNDLQYLKADDLYFSALRNRLGLFGSQHTLFQVDKRVKALQPLLEIVFGSQANPGEGSRQSIQALDIGCGQGNFLLTLIQDYSLQASVGIDISAQKLKTAIANMKALTSAPTKTEEDKTLAKEIRTFLHSCPKNLLFEDDLKLFERFLELVKSQKTDAHQNGRSDNKFLACSNLVNFKLQNIFNFDTVTKFELIFCLRMSKWVFLSLGEDSMRLLLHKCLLLLTENGVLVVSKVERKSFKATARVIHKKKNTTQLFHLHESIVADFVIRNGLTEIERFKSDKHLWNGFWMLTRKENHFWTQKNEN